MRTNTAREKWRKYKAGEEICRYSRTKNNKQGEGGHSTEKTAVFYIAALLVFIPLVMAIVIMQPYKPTYLTYNAVLVLLPAYCVLLLCV